MHADSSFSKTYLTKSNNYYEKPHEITDDEKILEERRQRNEQLKKRIPSNRLFPSLLRSVRPASAKENSSKQFEQELNTEGAMASVEDVDAPPESSDEEETMNITASKPSLPTPENTQTARNKRPLTETTGNNRRSKRSKLSPPEGLKPSSQPPANSQASSMGDFLSQSSQKRKAQKYGKTNKVHLYKPSPEPDTPEKPKTTLAIPDELPSTPASKKSKKFSDKLQLPEDFSSPPEAVQLYVPTFDDDGNVDDADAIVVKLKTRTGSSSSLSSVDSWASVQLDKATKKRYNNELVPEKSDLPPGYVKCPVCKRQTLKEGLLPPKSKKGVKDLSLKEMHKFCFDHRMRDAKKAWSDAHYPDANFDELLAPTRLDKYFKGLASVIQRKQKSFYLDRLDVAIADAKGNQRKVNHFFQTEVMTFTHNGYYGPRGAKKIALAIAADDKIIKQFRKAEKTDKAFRVANLARAIDSILLPEVLVMLVQDDMYLTHDEDGQAEARTILEESEEIGILLAGDDNDDVEDSNENDEIIVV